MKKLSVKVSLRTKRGKPENFYFDITEGSNFPSTQLVHHGWHGDIKKKSGKLENVLKSNKAFFAGYLPNRKKVKILILEEPPWNRLDERSIEDIALKKLCRVSGCK